MPFLQMMQVQACSILGGSASFKKDSATTDELSMRHYLLPVKFFKIFVT